MKAAYTGHEALTFPDYIDAAEGRTLHAEPGCSYDVMPASGRNVPDLPAGWFTPVLIGAYPPQVIPAVPATASAPAPDVPPQPQPEAPQPQGDPQQ